MGDFGLTVMLPRLMEGAATTLAITAIVAPLAFALSIAVGLCRLSGHWLVRSAATVYVELFRGTSLLVQLFFLYYVLPLWGVDFSAWTTGVLALTLNFGSYGSEIVRGAFLGLPRGQIEASLVLLLSPQQTIRRVLLPQAIPVMLPPFGNLLIELLKATSLLSLITIADLSFAGNGLAQTTGRFGLVFSFLLILYFFMAFLLTVAMRSLERRFAFNSRLVRKT